MGWFTNRTKNWEIISMVPMVVTTLVFFYSPQFPLILMGIIGKYNRWIVKGTLLLVIQCVGLFFMVTTWSTLIANICIPIVILTTIYTLFYTLVSLDIYLQRLDLKSSRILNPNQKHQYTKFTSLEGNTTASIPVTTTTTSGIAFIENLTHWQKEIESLVIKEHLTQMIAISKQIIQRDPNESELFFMRYSDTTNKVLNQYDIIENAGINSDEMINSLKKLEEAIGKIRESFEKELINRFKNDLLDVNSESEALLQTLKNKGLIE